MILQDVLELLATFVDDEPCWLDHHGYCQAHCWLDDGECNVARARKLLQPQQWKVYVEAYDPEGNVIKGKDHIVGAVEFAKRMLYSPETKAVTIKRD